MACMQIYKEEGNYLIPRQWTTFMRKKSSLGLMHDPAISFDNDLTQIQGSIHPQLFKDIQGEEREPSIQLHHNSWNGYRLGATAYKSNEPEMPLTPCKSEVSEGSDIIQSVSLSLITHKRAIKFKLCF
mgnify:CR=1 FL=1